MYVSVILSTYNHPKWLHKVLTGYAAQTRRPDQILIADDGSTNETALLVDSFQRSVDIPVTHIWHSDSGFRKCVILNRAIENAVGNYLIFSDGDCIPRDDFVATHCRLARTKRFLSGGMLRLPSHVSQNITDTNIVSGETFSTRWLLRNGFRIERQLKLLSLIGRAAEFADHVTSTRPTFNGHNASVWKDDILRANGFDERMCYGGLDRELGERLENKGIRGFQIRHRAICVHLHHARPYLDQTAIIRNQQIRKETAASNATRTNFGIQQAGDSNKATVLQTRVGKSESTSVSQAIQHVVYAQQHIDDTSVNT